MKPTDFSIHVTNFLTHHLAAQRNLSPNTIKAYRDVFTLLLRYCRDVRGIALERLKSMRISHETIYQALYIQGRGALRRELTACLRTGRALRVPRARTQL